MQVVTTQSSERSSFSDRALNRGLRHKLRSVRYAVSDSLFLVRSRWMTTMCIWRGAYRSFLGHIRILSPTELLVPHCGSAAVASPAQGWQPNIRTIARMEYTKKLLHRLPWLDTVDLRIFLMGFDAGEQFLCGKADNESKTHVEFEPRDVPSWDTYFVSPNKAVMGQVSDANPATIAGVTRRDESTRQKL